MNTDSFEFNNKPMPDLKCNYPIDRYVPEYLPTPELPREIATNLSGWRKFIGERAHIPDAELGLLILCRMRHSFALVDGDAAAANEYYKTMQQLDKPKPDSDDYQVVHMEKP